MTIEEKKPASPPPGPDDESREVPAAAAGGEASEDAGGEARDGGTGAEEREALLLSLQDAQAKAEEHWNEVLKARAELANLQKRAERDVQNAYKYSLENFVNELLPVIDSLELGLHAASEGGGPDPEKLREGMELTLKLMESAAAKAGLKAIDPQGERFNPELHQAMSMQPASGVAPNTVITVYQKGYLLNDRLIRPAMVVVSGPSGQDAGEERDPRGQSSGPRIDELA